MQLLHLIVVVCFGQGRREVTQGHLFSRAGEALQWKGGLLDLTAAEQVDGYQSCEHQCQDGDVQNLCLRQDHVFGSHNNHHPAHVLHGAVVQARLHAIHLRHTGASVGQHHPTHLLVDERHHACFVRM